MENDYGDTWLYNSSSSHHNFNYNFINQILWNFGGVIAFVFTADLANDNSLTKIAATLLVSIVVLSSVFIRLLLGLVGKYVYLDVIISFATGHILRGIGIILLPLSINLIWYSCLCSIGIGVGFGIQVGLLVPTYNCKNILTRPDTNGCRDIYDGIRYWLFRWPTIGR